MAINKEFIALNAAPYGRAMKPSNIVLRKASLTGLAASLVIASHPGLASDTPRPSRPRTTPSHTAARSSA
jgi:hypothetical protein